MKVESIQKKYYGCDGLNIAGVATISGKAMGGWIQYSLSPTTSSWLAQHFYLQWRYSMDRKFLAERAYPFLTETAQFLENITIHDENGKRKLPISSSPEINDNQINAWFYDNTNFDLALMKWVFIKSAELAHEMKDEEKAKHYESIAKEFPEFSTSVEDGLLIAKNYPLKESQQAFFASNGNSSARSIAMGKRSRGKANNKIISSKSGKDRVEVVVWLLL